MNKLLDIIKIGKNATHNTELVAWAHLTCKNYIWFHVLNKPSAHLILCQEKPKHFQIVECAKILRSISKYKSQVDPLEIEYTEVKNVKITSTPGLVITKNTKTIRV